MTSPAAPCSRAPRALDDGAVRVRRPEPSDDRAVYLAVDRSRSELEAWMPWCTPGYSLADAQAWIMAAAMEWPTGALCPLVIEDLEDGEIVGACGLDLIESVDRVHKLGYWVRSDRVGCGIARRAARLAARFAFDHLGGQRIDILVATDNRPSQAVAEAIGARREGVLASRFLLNGVRHDAVIYGLLPQWLAGESRQVF